MPLINIVTSNSSSGIVTQYPSTDYGESITSTNFGSTILISEDITKQISDLNLIFKTSFLFKRGSLEVFINGLKMSSTFDFIESEELDGFQINILDADQFSFLNNNSCMLIKYIKTDNISPDDVVTILDDTIYGENIIQSAYGLILNISEDISKQISSSLHFNTSYYFKRGSLEVFINGLKMSPSVDFTEDSQLCGFSFVSLDVNFLRILNNSSCISVNYAKS